MTPQELRNRTKNFAVRIFKLYKSLPLSDETRIIGKQLLRSATSMASNYRAVCRARSRQEFFSKISVVIEESDETVFWLEFIKETKIIPDYKIKSIYDESIELLKIMSASRKTLRAKYINHQITKSPNH